MRNGDVKHLCDDACFKRFRSSPTTFLRAPPKVATPPAAAPSKPVAEAQQTYKTCSVCQLMNINTSKPFLSWQGLDYCGEECLGKFQTSLSGACAYCTVQIAANAKAKFCIKVGNDIKQFCGSACQVEFKKRLKLCAFCNKDLSKVPDSFMAPAGGQATFKDFCSQTCLTKFEEKSNKDVEIIGVESKAKTVPKTLANSNCAVCSKFGSIKHEVKFEGKVHKLCSDPCFSAFQYANKLTMNTCDNCGVSCYNEGSQPHYVQFEGMQKRFCSNMCVNTFRTLNKKVVSCAWCRGKKNNFDMIERVDANNKYQLFCSLNCLSLYRVNLQATSNQAVTCDKCRKFVPAQYHLTMSDASVRNFCSYNCVMAFQAQFSTGTGTSKQATQNQTQVQKTVKQPIRGKYCHCVTSIISVFHLESSFIITWQAD